MPEWDAKGNPITQEWDAKGNLLTTDSPSFWSLAGRGFKYGQDVLEGLGSSLGATALGTSKLLRRVPQETKLEDIGLEPRGKLQSAVKTGADIGQFFLPAGQISKAEKALKAISALKRIAPVIRPGLEAISAGGIQAAQTGDVREAATTGAVAGGVSGGVAALPGAVSRLRGPAKSAIDWAERQGIPISAGQKLGSHSLEKLEKGLENVLGASGKAQRFFSEQQEKLLSAGKKISGGGGGTEVETGEALSGRLSKLVAGAKASADDLYGRIREMYSKGRVIEKGKAELVERARPDGTVWTEFVRKPDIVHETPIDIRRIRNQLQPIYEELMQTMPEAKRQSSPGFQALRQLINSPDTVDAVIADRNLSAIKAIVRGGGNPYLTDRSQGIAKMAVGELSKSIENGLNAVNPDLLPTLQQARKVVYGQHVVAEILNELPKEPAQLYAKMVIPGDKTFSKLAVLNSLAPKEVKEVGRTYLNGMIQKMAEEGDITRAAGVYRNWQNMGPHTKQLLFGDKVSDLNNFFLAAKRLTADVNPSGTAKAIFAMAPAFALLYGSDSLKDRTKRVGGEIGGAALLAEVLLNPRASKAFTAAVQKLAAPSAASIAALMREKSGERYGQ